jgi:riboflavin kinase/FMN adenylyltransferase
LSDEVPKEYGWSLEVGFLRKIREEKKFESVERLKEQIARDVAEARTLAG